MSETTGRISIEFEMCAFLCRTTCIPNLKQIGDGGVETIGSPDMEWPIRRLVFGTF